MQEGQENVNKAFFFFFFFFFCFFVFLFFLACTITMHHFYALLRVVPLTLFKQATHTILRQYSIEIIRNQIFKKNFIVHFVKISLFFSLSIFPAFFILFFVLSFVLVVVR